MPSRRRDRIPLQPRRPAIEKTVPVATARPAEDPRLRFAILFLRLFLGVTFVYAGLQKISDPGFLHPGSATYIGAQLTAFARTSPIGFLLNGVAIPLGPITGVGVLATELAVGVLVLAGVFTRPAAAVGALVNFTLFLTASWQVQPYFLGSDSIYTVAWIVLAVAGDLGFWTLEPALRRGLDWSAPPPMDPSRRQLLVRAGGAAVGLVWLLAILPRLSPARSASAAHLTPSPSPGGSPGPSPSAGPTPAGTAVGTLNQLQSSGGSLQFQIQSTGDPGLVVGLGGNSVAAFDAVCTHAGCTVQYDPTQKLIVCPCHGAEYDPAKNAEVVAGPAPTPLTPLKAQVAADGTIYVQ